MDNLLNEILGSITEEQVETCARAMEQDRGDTTARLIMIAFDQE